jgi:hypothetical protein
MTPQQRQRAQRRTNQPQQVPAPLGGWNTRDAFEAMDPKDAVLLDNWFPDFGGLTSRGGTVSFATGLDPIAGVQTLAILRAGTINKFLAAAGGKIFDISSGGAAGTPLASGFVSDVWQTVHFNSRSIWVNGRDPAQIYDGTTWGVAGYTGADTSTFSGVGAFNNRVYFWTGKDPSFWYGPVLGIGGALSNFPLSMVTREGGNLMAVEVLSYDGGTGIDDYTCFFMTSGEVMLYQGTDPSNPNNWALVGRYMIPAPVAQRGIFRYGGDIYIMSANDHEQFSKRLIALKLGETAPRTKISGAATAAYIAGKNLPGWQAIYYAIGTRMIYNIPNINGTFSQHIYNTSNQSWCRFRGMPALCWGIYNDHLYYGGPRGMVMQADIGAHDAGSPILCQGQQAWQTFQTPLIKRVTAVRPVVQSNGVAMFNLGLGYDYQLSGISFPGETVGLLNALIWGAGNWGPPRVWGGNIGVTDPRWHIGGGQGSAVGISLAANASVATTWIRTDLLIEPGRAL